MARVRDTISCVFVPRTLGANSVRLRHETRTRHSLKATTKISPTLENKNVPILRSQNTQNTRTPLKTGSEQSVKLLFMDSGTLIHFRWINLKLALSQHNNHKTHSRNLNWGLTFKLGLLTSSYRFFNCCMSLLMFLSRSSLVASTLSDICWSLSSVALARLK